MDAATALLTASKGVRARLGVFAPPQVLATAAELLSGVAEALAGVATLESKTDEEVTAADVTRLAAERRVADLFDTQRRRDACTHSARCKPGCRHVLMMLLLSDQEIRAFVDNFLAHEDDVHSLVRSARRIVQNNPSAGLLPGAEGTEGMPDPDPEE